MSDMERKVEALTNEISKKCGGQGAGVVIGACLNMIMTAAQLVPDAKMRAGIAMSFRQIADQLDKMAGPKQ